jgi:hypothetical protein
MCTMAREVRGAVVTLTQRFGSLLHAAGIIAVDDSVMFDIATNGTLAVQACFAGSPEEAREVYAQAAATIHSHTRECARRAGVLLHEPIFFPGACGALF